jgi:1-acyl-sn-glycerol-3-phosphate acyltransferase
MNALRGCWRLAGALCVAVGGWATIVLLFPRLSATGRQQRVQAWARRMLRVLGVTLDVRGDAAVAGPLLLVANHISWLDILVMHAARHCRFVAKSDVKGWPLIGTLATGGGTLYIERESRRDAMRVVHRMADSLRQGEVLAVFPEGTTTDGLAVLPFHGNLIQAAISSGAAAQPVALTFIDASSGRPCLSASYIGDDSLVGSLWRSVTGAPIAAVVRFGSPQHANGRDRRCWAQDLRAAVEHLRSG